MRSRFMLVAFVLTLNNFFYAVNPAAAKPIFDWIEVVALVLVFMEKILGSRGETEALVVTVPGRGAEYAYNYLAKWQAVDWRAEPCGWLWCRLRFPCSSMRASC